MGGDAWQALEQAIDRGELARAVELLEPLDEAERRKLSARARDKAKSFPMEERWAATGPRRLAVVVADAAVLGTAGPAAAARATWMWDAPDIHARLIRCRSREWRQDWAERVTSETEVSLWYWQLVHELVVAGLIDRPAADGYVTGAVMGMAYPYLGGDQRRRLDRPLVDVLRSQPEWLEHDLWRLFELEEANLTSLDHDYAGHGRWSAALVTLAGEGAVPRDRLLDASLAALRRDFSPHNARWYHKFHEALEPTPEEHLARLDELLALLGSTDPAIVGFALRALAKAERSGGLPADRLFEALPPALLVPAKGHATRAVKLAGRVLKRDGDAATLAVPLLVEGLAHESRDVQELVLDVLERHNEAVGDDARERLAAFAEHADPAVRGRIAALAGETGDEAEPAGPAVAVPGRRAPRPRTLAEPLAPPADVEELLDRIAVALERDDDPDEVELLLDGISRLRAEPVPAGRDRALVERARAVSPLWRGEMGLDRARDALVHLLYRWIGDREDKHRWATRGPSPRQAIAVRIGELGDDLRRKQPRALLARPTHPGGWIEPLEAVRRIEALGGDRPLEMDLAQLVLRIAPDEHGRALAAAADLKGEAAGVLTLALGGEAKRPLLSRLKAAWAAAAHARDPAEFVLPERPREDLETHRMSMTGLMEAKEARPASPADLLCLEHSWWGWEPSMLERWLTTVWPANREPVHHIVVRRLWINTGTREYGIADVIEVLLDPSEPVRPEAALALTLALGAADAEARAVAADVTIGVLRDRRLEGADLGDLFATLLRHQTEAVPSRWAPSLADVAAAGPLQAHDVQAAIERVLAAAGDEDRRRLLGLVDLLRVLAVEADAAVTDVAARAWLGALGKGTKIGRAGREALAVTGDGAARSRAAVAELEAP